MRTLFILLCLWVHFSGDVIESVYEDFIFTACLWIHFSGDVIESVDEDLICTALPVSSLFWWCDRVSIWGLHLYSLPVNSLFWWSDRVSISLWGPHLYCFACDALHEIHTDLKLSVHVPMNHRKIDSFLRFILMIKPKKYTMYVIQVSYFKDKHSIIL